MYFRDEIQVQKQFPDKKLVYIDNCRQTCVRSQSLYVGPMFHVILLCEDEIYDPMFVTGARKGESRELKNVCRNEIKNCSEIEQSPTSFF